MKRSRLRLIAVISLLVVVATLAVVLSTRRWGMPWVEKLSISHQLATLINQYEYLHGTLPYTDTGSVRGYLRELEDGVEGFDFARVKRFGKCIVYVNMRPDEWEKVQDVVREKWPGRGVLVAWWARTYAQNGRSRRAALYWMRGYVAAMPVDEDELRYDLRAADEAIRETLGKTLADCIVYEKGYFDPSLLEPENGSSPAANGPTEPGDDQ